MNIGVVKEIKKQEFRVGLVPGGVKALKALGADIVVESAAGLGSGISDDAYAQAGAKVVMSAKEVWQQADIIIKVKEPLSPEFNLIQPKQTIYTYLHLAVCPELAKVLISKKITAIGYETIQLDCGALPLLKPMSEVAGKMAVQVGATYLQSGNGGKGILLGGVPGIPRGKVTILGAGVVGTNACKVAVGLGANVTVVDINADRLEYLDDIYGSRVTTLVGTTDNIERSVVSADLVIGAVLIAGAKAPKLVTRDMVRAMGKGSVIVDVSVDQGGCVETSRPTTYDQPTYLVDDIIHCGVANLPGAVARSSTFALTNATLGYAKWLVSDGVMQALRCYEPLARGVNTMGGYVTHRAVADGLELPFRPLTELI